MAANLHRSSPTLMAQDPRRHVIRSVAYHRAHSDELVEARITRQTFNANGHEDANWDPRLWSRKCGPNLNIGYSLSGHPLRSESVDAGWRVRLMGCAGELLSEWDSRHTLRQIEHDSLLRPIAVMEQADGELPSVIERMNFAENSLEFAVHNQCAKLIRHDDPAGSRQINEYGLAGGILSESRRFLNDLLTPNWPQALSEREKLLETEIATTCWQFNATGEVANQRDARNNQTLMAYNVAGELQQIQLKRENLPDKTLLSQVIYGATGQIEQEVGGNGVRTVRRYEAQTDRLLRLTSSFGTTCYQDYHYDYDAVGNITRIEDTAQPVQHFRNRRTEPVSTYRYDTLYQLIEATGRESIPTNNGPGLPELHTPMLDPTRMGPYKQTFVYDAAGNLRTLVHEGSNGYTRELITSPLSNRSLLKPESGEPDFNSGFDPNGNLQVLAPGTQTLQWDTRNQLSGVVLVDRANEENDDERYRYDAQGQRVRKIRINRTKTVVNTSETRYLPGLELHHDNMGEERYVINIETGSGCVRVLQWTRQTPKYIRNNQIRYSLSNHLGSSMLELDDEAGVLSQEGYYAFGGTAWWAARSESEAKYKTIRYSMKEQDATGLYYYGFRYYAPWLMRWCNPDPSGDIDGPNRYLFVKNNPIMLYDNSGTESKVTLTRHQYWLAKLAPLSIASSKLATLFLPLLPKNVTIQPSTIRGNGAYASTAGFRIKRVNTEEASKILIDFENKYENLRSHLERKVDSAKNQQYNAYNEDQIDNLTKGASISASAQANLDMPVDDHEHRGLFKLVDKKNRVHAFSFTTRNDEKLTLNIDDVVAHPYSQLSELSGEYRQELAKEFEGFDSYLTKKTGSVLTFLTIAKEIKASPARVKFITTNAINERSANIVKKFNPGESVNPHQRNATRQSSIY
ncbi:RHS repeat domain-containing protein [Pseudomonas sp. A-R-19]|uniref:RHS repeat domain-containing protein n=1 Tax=Pseudomonas sp. A-R-19 TaxID=2832403 RepID=UPI001CBEB699|nr:RHS repeat-associated core domain-containing protein [Pseudomonas sp. A-R-19]